MSMWSLQNTHKCETLNIEIMEGNKNKRSKEEKSMRIALLRKLHTLSKKQEQMTKELGDLTIVLGVAKTQVKKNLKWKIYD